MANEIKVTFEDGGIYDGFASTYTLGNDVTYYFSFDRDYRVQLNSAGNIVLQEYRNAGAWYPIDIISAVALPEIATSDVTKEWVQQNFQPKGNYLTKAEADKLYAPIGSTGGGVTEDWVKDNFVLKAGDTMSGPLKFDFGSGAVIEFNYTTGHTERGAIKFNGTLLVQNDNKQTTAIIQSTTAGCAISLYKAGTTHSALWFRDYEYGSDGNSRYITYNRFNNGDSNSTWLMYGKFQTNNDWFFKGNIYVDVNLYARLTSQSDLIGVVVNGNGIQLYSDKTVAIHKLARGETNQYYTTYKADGRNTVSTVGGQDPQYRIVGYNNFVNSVEHYDKVTIKNEGETAARTVMQKGYILTYDSNNKKRTELGNGLYIYDSTETKQFQILSQRFDVYNGHALICHNGAGGGGSDDVQATFQYDGIKTYNYSLKTFTINGSAGAVTIQSDISSGGTGVRVNVPNGHYSLTESTGTVTGAGLYTTCNEFYYSESMLNALNACLGHIFDKIGASYYVQFSGQSYSTGGGKSRGGGVGRR